MIFTVMMLSLNFGTTLVNIHCIIGTEFQVSLIAYS